MSDASGWIHAIISSAALFPEPEMTDQQRFAALFRLVIILTVIFKLVMWNSYDWLKFLGAALVVLAIAYLSLQK